MLFRLTCNFEYWSPSKIKDFHVHLRIYMKICMKIECCLELVWFWFFLTKNASIPLRLKDRYLNHFLGKLLNTV